MSKLFTPYLLGILFVSLLDSCENNDIPPIPPTHYKGVLLDYATRMPVPSNKVYLITWASERLDDLKLWTYSYADTSLILPNTPKGTVDSAITDINGVFSFPYPPQVDRKDFLGIYWPTLGNHDPKYCFTKYVFTKTPYNYLDTFFTEPPCVLKITMQKSSAADTGDLTFQKIDFYRSTSALITKQYFMGQKGKTNHTVEIPYSKNLANVANFEFRYNNNGWKYIYKTTLTLQPSGTTNIVVTY